MFWRLLTVADDYGRFQAEAELILATCYSRMLLTILTADIITWKEELEEQDVIRLYESDGKEYGYFVNWHKYQDRRAKRSKYPDPANICTHVPACASTCSQMPANVPVSEDRGSYPRNVSVSVSVSGDLAHANRNGQSGDVVTLTDEDLRSLPPIAKARGITIAQAKSELITARLRAQQEA
jgi:hypothetical protein